MELLIFILITLSSNFLSINGEDCINIGDYECTGDEDHFIDEEYDNTAFQTPPRNDILGRYRSTYQDMRYLVGYAQQKYSEDKKACTLSFYTRINPILGEEGTDYYIKYYFGEYEKDINFIELNSEEHSYPNGMTVLTKIFNKKSDEEIVKLELEDEYFLWDNLEITLPEEYENGQRGSIV